MNKHAVVGGLWLWGALLILGAPVFCSSWVQYDDHERSTIRHLFLKLINKITDDDMGVLNSDEIMDFLKDFKSSLIKHSSINTSRVNWFMQCVNNCVHTYDDKNTTPSGSFDGLGPLSVSGNVTVEILFKCNHRCATQSPGIGLIGR